MSERLPYEEQLQQHWTDLPLPDESMAWADMKRRLEEDNDDGIVWWRSGCVLWGLGALLLLSIGWWLIRYEQRTSHSNKKQDLVIQQPADSIPAKRSNTDSTGNAEQTERRNDHIKEITNSETTGPEKKQLPGIGEPVTTDVITTGAGNKRNKPAERKNSMEKRNTSVDFSYQAPGKRNVNTKTKAEESPDNRKENLPDISKPSSRVTTSDSVTASASKSENIPHDSILTEKNKKVIKAVVKPADKDSTKKDSKTDSLKQKKFFFSAGIAMQQQLPVAGQKATPYNSLGRKGTLSDYIPSVYFRYTKDKKWFVQSEFRYGAPQYTKEFLYSNLSKLDSSGPSSSFTSITLKKLKKTYYHQLSATFNYYVMPDWSVGGGIIWNKFSSAVTDQEVLRRRNGAVGDSVVSHGIIKDKNNSAFSKSYLQALFETQYQWKRFSLGARYSFGLQPYIRFRLDGGTEQKEKNSSIQLFLRYELWRSKK